MQQLAYAFADGATIARRNVIKIIRVPEILIFVLIPHVRLDDAQRLRDLSLYHAESTQRAWY